MTREQYQEKYPRSTPEFYRWLILYTSFEGDLGRGDQLKDALSVIESEEITK